MRGAERLYRISKKHTSKSAASERHCNNESSPLFDETLHFNDITIAIMGLSWHNEVRTSKYYADCIRFMCSTLGPRELIDAR